jgi:ketosteroid isomerase-like protein
MTQSSALEVVQQGYAEFGTGNIEAVLGRYDAQIEWSIPRVDGVRVTGTRRGVDAVREFFQMLAEDQQAIRFEPREFVATGDTVAAIGEYRWRVTSTGKEFECPFTHVFKVRDGKITSFREFTDTAAVAAAYRR